jgi:hypothetical protein
MGVHGNLGVRNVDMFSSSRSELVMCTWKLECEILCTDRPLSMTSLAELVYSALTADKGRGRSPAGSTCSSARYSEYVVGSRGTPTICRRQ